MPTPEELRKLIGENLAHIREESGMSKSELGEALGYNRYWVLRRETGQSSIDFEDVPQLMDALGIDDPRILWDRGGGNGGCDRGSRYDFDGY